MLTKPKSKPMSMNLFYIYLFEHQQKAAAHRRKTYNCLFVCYVHKTSTVIFGCSKSKKKVLWLWYVRVFFSFFVVCLYVLVFCLTCLSGLCWRRCLWYNWSFLVVGLIWNLRPFTRFTLKYFHYHRPEFVLRQVFYYYYLLDVGKFVFVFIFGWCKITWEYYW